MEYNGSLKNKKVLITCGPTWTPIDPVRVISNISSGELAHAITEGLLAKKAKVVLLQGPVTHPFSNPSVTIKSFKYFNELSTLLTKELKKSRYDIIIHAAAVSDYQPKLISSAKMSSRLKNPRLRLIPTKKLILQVKKICPKIFLVGFKLEAGTTLKNLLRKAQRLLKEASCDLVVANACTQKSYQAYILDKNDHIQAKAHSRKEIAQTLIRTMENSL